MIERGAMEYAIQPRSIKHWFLHSLDSDMLLNPAPESCL